MSPFEAHILIQQATTTIPSAGSFFPSSSSCSSVEKSLLEALKSHRLNPNLRFKNESLLSTCIKKGCANLLKLFLEHGADPNLKSYENGRYEPALITAVRYKSLRCVQILLEHGANLSKTNFYGTDAVFQAVHENAHEILDCLLCSERQSQHDPTYYQHQRQKRDVPTAGFSSFSSSSPPPHQSIIIQKTTATMKEMDSKGGERNQATRTSVVVGPKEAQVVLNREKPSNNNNCSIKGHAGDDDHVLCPFYYALNSALSYPSKRASLALLLQSYYKCKCLEEISSCCGAAAADGRLVERTNSPIEDDQVKECLRVVLPNFSPTFSSNPFAGENKSVPPASIHDDDDDDVRQQYYYGTHHHPDSLLVHADNENDIRFQSGTAAAGRRVVGGGEGNELSATGSSRNLFPYKVYKIRGKCHVIKENESSSSTSSPPSPTAAQQRPSSSYVVLVGPLKLSCITREVIRDQIMRSAQTNCTSTAAAASTTASANGSTQSGSTTNTTTVASRHHQLPSPFQSTSGDAVRVVIGTQEEQYLRKRNFRKSLKTLTMPSALMDYVLYKNIQWNNGGGSSSGSAMNGKGEKSSEENENNERYRSTTNIDNIRLIKRDLELNINYFAIYIY